MMYRTELAHNRGMLFVNPQPLTGAYWMKNCNFPLDIIFLAGVYGGCFGAAQGIMVFAVLTLSIDDSLLRINALRNILVGLVNLVAGLVFIAVADVAWRPALIIAGGSIVGGQIGARLGRRLPPWGLRIVIVTVGVLAIVKVLL